MLDEIRIKRAAQHNLKHIDVTLPRNKLIVVTGPSGSGKSSLAFDTIFAEGQRRYIECLSAYARQFIDQMEKPDVESIEGISPSISIDQKTISTNPRSTVGTITEVSDLLRLLFARVGTPHCPSCGRVVSSQTPEEILRRIAADHAGAKVRILAPVVKGRKGEYQRLFERLRKKGFLRARVNGTLRDLDDDIPLEKSRKHTIEVLVDAIKIGPDAERRLGLAVAKALEVSDGEVLVVDEAGRERFFSLTLLCPFCEVSLAELEPRNFSFNSPYGACPKCHGLGYRAAPNEWGEIELTDEVCPDCGGTRFKPETLSVRIDGRNIHEVGELSIGDLLAECAKLEFPPAETLVASRSSRRSPPVSPSWRSWGCPTSSSTGRLPPSPAARPSGSGSRPRSDRASAASSTFSTSRRSASTSATTAASSRSCAASATTATRSSSSSTTSRRSARPTTSSTSAPGRARRAASRSPRAPWPPSSLRPTRSPPSTCAARSRCPVPAARRKPAGWLVIRKAREHNLKGIDVRIPLASMTAVTGVSGSGKSTLVYDILFKALENRLHKARQRVGAHERMEGIDGLDKVVAVDQKPIGRTPRSNPATYTGLFAALRDLMARTPEARARGYASGRFSFNVAGGRCEDCEGAGVKRIEMHFLPDVFVTCDRCEGRRYNKETLAVTYKGRSIADYLAMTVDDAYELLKAYPQLKRKLATLKQGRPRLHPARPARAHPLRRRGPAHQADERARAAGHRADALPPRRADDRPPLRRRPQAPRGPRRARLPRQHGRHHRAQP